ncbi:hypothetical protein PybrP1_000478 [[Pythium] brassicae (nom. inval.)]|nr:hypothetical protein PybrP1_000478 [[Pythium] brassicae (nom. inval.)]
MATAESPAAETAPSAEEQPSPSKLRPVKKFAHIVSPLDPADALSGVHTSEFRGLYHLALIAGALYALTAALSNLLARGGLYDARLLLAVFYSWHFVEVLATFACQALFSYTALIPVYLATTRWCSSRLLINIVHHFLQSVMFVFTVGAIIIRDWNTIHAVSAFVECVVLLMKMHSYIRTKLELARAQDTLLSVSVPPDVRDFSVYLFHPTLVYEPEFPRTDRIRWGYVAEKVCANALAMGMFYIIVTDHVIPKLEDAALANPVLVVVNLLLPFLGCYLMTWFIIFECICNGLAELTYLADRDFYGDWWNSTTFDEFARKWNKPVHEFLLRHVYLESLETYKLSKRSATLFTFLISAALHECVFAIVFRTVKMYFFILQMLQVVVVLYGRGLKGTRLGNYIFWLGMILGPPLQAVLYCREYHGGEPIFMDLMVPVMIAGFGSALIGSLLYLRAARDPKPHQS